MYWPKKSFRETTSVLISTTEGAARAAIGASTITVRTSDGTSYEATLVGADSKTDVAVLKIDATGPSSSRC